MATKQRTTYKPKGDKTPVQKSEQTHECDYHTCAPAHTIWYYKQRQEGSHPKDCAMCIDESKINEEHMLKYHAKSFAKFEAELWKREHNEHIDTKTRLLEKNNELLASRQEMLGLKLTICDRFHISVEELESMLESKTPQKQRSANNIGAVMPERHVSSKNYRPGMCCEYHINRDTKTIELCGEIGIEELFPGQTVCALHLNSMPEMLLNPYESDSDEESTIPEDDDKKRPRDKKRESSQSSLRSSIEDVGRDLNVKNDAIKT